MDQILRNYLCVIIWQTMGCKVLAQGGLRGLPPSLIHGRQLHPYGVAQMLSHIR